nr:sigma-70 family RNA polymerase sigma factor [Tunicatimonas sp. TK19036]
MWEEFKLGNKQAFDYIYDQFFQSLCYYGDKICDDKNLVEDVVQDLFIYLWARKERLGKTTAIKFYLFRCLRRKLIRVVSQEKKRPDPFSTLKKESIPFQLSLQQHTTHTVEEDQLYDKLTQALYQLTERQKEAIYLKFYNNLSFQEVAAVMEIEVRSVYNLIGRTVDILRKNLNQTEVSITTLMVLMLSFLLSAT